jgi:hypothetical protein
MTAQICDLLYYNGEGFSLSCEPLEPFLEMLGENKPCSKNASTCCHRGYIGTWEITDGKLYLIGLKGYPVNEEFTVEYLFSGQARVLAEWFTDELRIPKGKMLHYEHLGYMSIFEKDLFIKIEKGDVISTREVDNSETFNPDDPLGFKEFIKVLDEELIKKFKAEDQAEA